MDIQRFEEQVQEIAKREVFKNRILFYGNSYFAFWGTEGPEKMLEGISDKKPVTLNHGFGGATSAELFYYYDRLIKPYEPSAIIWTEGANDFEQGYTVSEAFGYAEKVFDKARADFERIKLIFLTSIEVPKLTIREIDKAREYSLKLFEYSKSHNGCYCIDLNPFFYKNGNEFNDVFREDNTHLTVEGYKKFERFLRDKIMNFLMQLLKM